MSSLRRLGRQPQHHPEVLRGRCCQRIELLVLAEVHEPPCKPFAGRQSNVPRFPATQELGSGLGAANTEIGERHFCLVRLINPLVVALIARQPSPRIEPLLCHAQAATGFGQKFGAPGQQAGIVGMV